MMHAYDEQYLDDAMRNLGEAADYAVNACNMTLQKFFDLFVQQDLLHSSEIVCLKLFQDYQEQNLFTKSLQKQELNKSFRKCRQNTIVLLNIGAVGL